MICFLKGLVFHRDASHLWWENDLKESALGKAEVGMTEGGWVAVWARPNKKPQIASNCSERRKQRAISHASTFSHRLKYFYDLGEILSNRVPVIWEGESYQCLVICPRHVREVRARLNCWSSVTFPLPRNVWRTIAREQQWHQTWENPAHLSQLEFCQKHTSYLSRTPRIYSCKIFLAGVNFYRFYEKNWRFSV